MGRANVYLPDDLERRVKAAGIAISEVCQRALLSAVEAAEGRGAAQLPDGVAMQYRAGALAGTAWTEALPIERVLTLVREQRLGDIPADRFPPDLYSLNQDQTLAWEAGFVQAALGGARALLDEAVNQSAERSTAADADPSDRATAADAPGAAGVADPARVAGASSDAGSADTGPSTGGRPAEQPGQPSVLGDESGCRIGRTVDGAPVSFDPHAAVRADKSPLFAVLGQTDLRSAMLLTTAQDAAARGAGVVVVDLSGGVVPQARGLGRKVRVVGQQQPAASPLEDLLRGGPGLGGLWEALSGLAGTGGLGGLRGFGGGLGAGGLADLLSPTSDGLLEPGYVSVIGIGSEGGLGSLLALGQAAHALTRSTPNGSFPRLLLVELPVGVTLPGAIAGRLGGIIRAAREQDVAVGLGAESASTVAPFGGRGALLSTVFAFATSNPVEATALRDLLGSAAPILLNPPGLTVAPSDETWVVMRDLEGRLGQVRLDG